MAWPAPELWSATACGPGSKRLVAMPVKSAERVRVSDGSSMSFTDAAPDDPDQSWCDESPLMVLYAAREFDEEGGVSLGLAAWEHCVSETSITASFDAIVERGLLVSAGWDALGKETMWRLTASGRKLCARLLPPRPTPVPAWPVRTPVDASAA
jgi:hypothetical protein